MVKILIVSPLALENGRGGEISSMELAAGLNKYYNTNFIHSNIFIGKKLLTNKVIEAKLNGVKIKTRIKFATFKISNLVFTFPYPGELIKFYRLIKKHNIIYTSCSTFKQNLMFMFFSLLHRHGRFIVGYRKPLYSNKLFSLYNFKYRLSILFFSLFKKRFYHHTLSKNTKRFLDKFYEQNKVIHIVHGIDLQKYVEEKEKNYDLLRFIYIGFLDDVHKGIEVLMDGIEKFLRAHNNPNVHFEISGMGPLEIKIKTFEKKYSNFIKFNGYISNEMVPEYYKKGDVYLFSSRVEPFPRAIMEALAANLVIIASKTIGSVELLKGKKFAFFMDKLNADIVSEKIFEVYQLWEKNHEEFIELQTSAKEYVFQNYSISRELEMFKELIQDIMINSI